MNLSSGTEGPDTYSIGDDVNAVLTIQLSKGYYPNLQVSVSVLGSSSTFANFMEAKVQIVLQVNSKR